MNHMEQALKIAEAQAHVRAMTADEIYEMVKRLCEGLKEIDETEQSGSVAEPPVPPNKAIKLKTITCLECGRVFKTLSKKHLESHGLTPDEYRDKWGYPRRTPLSCKETVRARSERMKDMKLWTRNKKGSQKPPASTPAKPKHK